MQLDLLDYQPRQYPLTAGFKEETTSKDAANAIEESGRAELLRVRCYDAIKTSIFGLTAKECASFLAEDINSVRPRLTELKERGLLQFSGLRRDKQHVWCVA